jgi:hypothetical protein
MAQYHDLPDYPPHPLATSRFLKAFGEMPSKCWNHR